MKLVCAYCGRQGTKEDMVLSKSTGNAYCFRFGCSRRTKWRKIKGQTLSKER